MKKNIANSIYLINIFLISIFNLSATYPFNTSTQYSSPTTTGYASTGTMYPQGNIPVTTPQITNNSLGMQSGFGSANQFGISTGYNNYNPTTSSTFNNFGMNQFGMQTGYNSYNPTTIASTFNNLGMNQFGMQTGYNSYNPTTISSTLNNFGMNQIGMQGGFATVNQFGASSGYSYDPTISMLNPNTGLYSGQISMNGMSTSPALQIQQNFGLNTTQAAQGYGTTYNPSTNYQTGYSTDYQINNFPTYPQTSQQNQQYTTSIHGQTIHLSTNTNITTRDLQITTPQRPIINISITFGDLEQAPRKEEIKIEISRIANLTQFLETLKTIKTNLTTFSTNDLMEDETVNKMEMLAENLMWLRYWTFNSQYKNEIFTWLTNNSDVANEIESIISIGLSKFHKVTDILSGEGVLHSGDISQGKEKKSAILGVIAGILIDIWPLYLKFEEKKNITLITRKESKLEDKIATKITFRNQVADLLAEYPSATIFKENSEFSTNKSFIINNGDLGKKFLDNLFDVRTILIGNMSSRYPGLGDQFSNILDDFNQLSTNIGQSIILAVKQSLQSTASTESQITRIDIPIDMVIKSEVLCILIWSIAKYLAIFIELKDYSRTMIDTKFSSLEIEALNVLIKFASMQNIFFILEYQKKCAIKYNLDQNLLCIGLITKLIEKTLSLLGDAITKAVDSGGLDGLRFLQKLIDSLDNKMWTWPISNITKDPLKESFKLLILDKLFDSIAYHSSALGRLVDNLRDATIRTTNALSNDVKEDADSLSIFISICSSLLNKAWNVDVFGTEGVGKITSAKQSAESKLSTLSI